MFGVKNKLERVQHIAIYLRKSRHDEGGEIEETLANHRRILTKIADEYHWSYEIFEEVASSIDMNIRTELTKMLKEIKKGKFDAVLVMDVDRLSRSVKDSAIIKAILAENQVLIITADLQVIDLNEDNDSLVSDFMDVLSSFEYKQIRKRMMRGKRAGAEKGEWNNGVAPFGYRVDKENKTLTIIEEEARVVKMVFHWAMQQKSCQWIANELNRLGIKTKKKNPFSDIAIRRMIHNETYKGDLIRHRIKWNGKKKEQHPEENWVIVKGALPAIVSEKEWEQANTALNGKLNNWMRKRTQTYGLSGLIRCGYCGYSLSIMKRKDRKTDKVIRCCPRIYPSGKRCQNSSISYYVIFEAVMENLRKYENMFYENIENETFRDYEQWKLLDDKYMATKQQLQKIEKAVKQLDIAWQEMVISLDEYKNRREDLLLQKLVLSKEMEKIKDFYRKNHEEEKEMLKKAIETFLYHYHSLTEQQLNNRFHLFIRSIQLFNNKRIESFPKIKIEYY